MYTNTYYGRTLGWVQRIDEITALLGLNSTPADLDGKVFTDGVRTWQSKQTGLETDGIVGPRTWGRIQAILDSEKSAGHKDKGTPNETLNPAKNLCLRLGIGVSRTVSTDPVIARLDKFFCRYSKPVTVTSVLRSPKSQLSVIISLAQKKLSIIPGFTNQDVDSRDPSTGNYLWQDVWTKLLQAGIIVNPPRRAPILADYKTAKGILRKKGHTISPSPHITGRAFDIGCNVHGVKTIADVVRTGKREELGGVITQILEEPKNNCVHVGTA